jgi:hypothetical protein
MKLPILPFPKNANSNAMRWRRETTHTARPAETSPLPHPLHPFSASPNRPAQRPVGDAFGFFSLPWTVRGKGDGWGGCGRGGKKLLGPYMVLLAPPALHLQLKTITRMSFNFQMPALCRSAAQNPIMNTRLYPKYRPQLPSQQPIRRQERDGQQQHRPDAQRAGDIHPIPQPLR